MTADSGKPPQTPSGRSFGPNIAGAFFAVVMVLCVGVGFFAFILQRLGGAEIKFLPAVNFSVVAENLGLYVLGSASLTLVTILFAFVLGKKLTGTEEDPGFAMRLFDFFWKPPKGRAVYKAEPGEIHFHIQKPSKLATVDYHTKWAILPLLTVVTFVATFLTLGLKLPLNIAATVIMILSLALVADIAYWLLEWDRRTTVFNIFTHKSRLVKIRKTFRGLMPIIVPLFYLTLLAFLAYLYPIVVIPIVVLGILYAIGSARFRRLLSRMIPGGHAGLPVTSDTTNERIDDIITSADPEDIAARLDEATRRKFQTGGFREFWASGWYRNFGIGSALVIYVAKAGTDILPWFEHINTLRDLLYEAKNESINLRSYIRSDDSQTLPKVIRGTSAPAVSSEKLTQLPPERTYDLFTGEVLSYDTAKPLAEPTTVNVTALDVTLDDEEDSADEGTNNNDTANSSRRRTPPIVP